ncbi:MAG: tRNA uridine-5-carboxymethylaminomethyl(34) synthesis GTPase MnmE [Clostridia bacterium]|nr:tRNA uridine-5-carboxymethylaminomethyl(34) synthesis GTPase MnmE [Clostridia bacterium]
MANLNQDTIVAISTGTSSGAISIVRLSGSNAIKIADQIFSTAKNKTASNLTPRMLTLGTVKTSAFNEQALCVVFKAPFTYTGEDLVEFQCHGGTQIANGIMKECIKLGARLATNGEFTKRAFLNGKMTLSSAEGMIDMINAESDAEVRAGFKLLSGNLSKLAFDAADELTDILSEIEVSFDYPEETIEFITKANVKERLSALSSKIGEVLKTAKAGSLIKSGINVLIVGKPNVGKSSLLNFLLQKERAIVTDVAGTTRDTIEDSFLLDDIKVNLIDTAGIHDTADKVEKIGVDKAKNLIKQADIVLFLVDSSRNFSKEDAEIFDSIQNSKYIVLKTKSDLETKNDKIFENEILISTATGSGVNELKAKILELTQISSIPADSVVITNERHKDALARAKQALDQAAENISADTLDLVSIDIKEAYNAIGEITGNTTSEEIIDAIFKKFCLGK